MNHDLISNPKSNSVVVGRPRLFMVVVSLLVVLFVTSLVYGLRSGDWLRYPDEKEYHRLALALTNGQGYVDPYMKPTAYRPPGYPFLISIVYGCSQHPTIIKALNSIFLLLSSVIAFFICQRISINSGIFCLIIICIYPIFLYSSAILYPQIYGSLLFLIVLLLVFSYPQKPVVIFSAGLIFGILVLTIPAFLLILPLLLFCLFRLTTGRMRMISVSIFVLVPLCVITPWSIRNYHQLGGFVLISSNSGLNLLVGNSENTSANSGVNVDISEFHRLAEDMDEVDRDRFFRSQALTWIRENPTRSVVLYAKKVLNYFNFRNELWTESEGSDIRWFFSALSYYPLLIIALIRLAFLKKWPFVAFEGWLFFFYFGNAFVSAIFFTRIRFRIPFDFLLVCIAAIFLARIWALIRRRWARDSDHDGTDLTARTVER